MRASRLRFPGLELLVISAPLPTGDAMARLSPTEREIALAVLQGKCHREIARLRRCSERTVANVVASIHRKLGVRSRAELALLVAGGLDRR